MVPATTMYSSQGSPPPPIWPKDTSLLSSTPTLLVVGLLAPDNLQTGKAFS